MLEKRNTSYRYPQGLELVSTNILISPYSLRLRMGDKPEGKDLPLSRKRWEEVNPYPMGIEA